jgi:SAM-dependent methyltransferase
MTDRTRARRLARESLERGDATGWFETLYAEADRGEAVVPWADLAPNPHVVEWLDREAPPPGRALDVGTGLGDTAADLARRGFAVVAFDVSATAVSAARRRFPTRGIDWRVADLLDLPREWAGGFDLIVECYTLQVLPPEVRPAAAAALAAALAPGGCLLVVARGREPHEPRGEMPWPLTRAEVEAIAGRELRLEAFEDFLDREDPPVRRFRAAFRRPRMR